MQTQHVLHYVWRQHPVKYQAQGLVLRRSTLPRFLDVCPHSGDVHSGNHDRSRFYHSSVDKKSVRSRRDSCTRFFACSTSIIEAISGRAPRPDRLTRATAIEPSSCCSLRAFYFSFAFWWSETLSWVSRVSRCQHDEITRFRQKGLGFSRGLGPRSY